MRIFLVLALSLVFFFPHQTNAAGLVNPFGGKVVMIIPCTCQVTGMAVYVVMPIPPYFGMFLWQPPITRPYLWYFPYPSVNILGNYVSGGVCLVGVAPYCVSVPVIGTMTQVGSSAK